MVLILRHLAKGIKFCENNMIWRIYQNSGTEYYLRIFFRYRGFLQAAVPSKSRLGRQKGLAAV